MGDVIPFRQYSAGFTASVDAILRDAIRDSRGRWVALTNPFGALRCVVCGEQATLVSSGAFPIARCACDRAAEEAAWREHFGVLAELG